MQAIKDGTLSPKDEQTLLRLGFLVPDPEAERRDMLDALRQMNLHGDSSRITVVLNLDCNLNCSYCFEGNRRGDYYLSAETADMLVQFISEKYLHKGKKVSIDFYGGEPLLSLDLIKGISVRLKEAAAKEGLEYSFGLVTNGTLLTRKTVEELVPLGLISAKVTLDGPRANHDIWRPFVNGKGSFDLILENMKDVCDLIRIQTGGNYSSDNYREFPRLLDLFLAEGLTPDRLSTVMFAPITKTLGEYSMPEFSEGCASVDEPWLMEASLYLREEILRRGFKTPKVSPSICLIEWDDFLVVNHDGKLYKCPAFIGMSGLEVGTLATGIKDYRASHNMDVWKKDECLDCPYLPLCFGGCRFLKLLQSGAIDDVECRRDYLDATLEAFLLQDLEYGGKKL